MKKNLFLCSLALAFGMSAMAQTDPAPSTGSSSGSMSQTPTSTQNSDMDHHNGSKNVSMKGCISQQGGQFMLMDKKHPEGVALNSSQDLSAHVGHKVEIKGNWADSASGSAASSGTGMSGSNAGGSSSGSKGINVTDVKMISDKCEMNSGSMK